MNTRLEHYLEAALWSSTDMDTDIPLDRDYSIADISEETTNSAKEDLESFAELAGDLLDHIEDGQIGHDFWLTRNHHGAGFWDRTYPDTAPENIGDRLTEIAHSFGSLYLHVSDGKVYGE